MAVRPTDHWRTGVAEEARALAAGQLGPDEAFMSRLFPDSLLRRTDEVLAAFETELGALDVASEAPSDARLLGAVRRVVLALNAVNEEHGGAGYETDERERLCDYIDTALTEAGVDLDALTARHGLGRHGITDEWRDW